jgi:phospholipase C
MPDIRQLVDTIVLVMMENRSFDHVLGFLSHEDFDARTDIDGLHRAGPAFDWSNADAAGNPFSPKATPDGYLPTDLPHSRTQIAQQLAQGAMAGFIQAYFGSQAVDQSPVPMRFCSPADVPISAALARSYCVCDRWFSAVPADTQPNRLMAIAGTTLIDSTDSIQPPLHLLPNQRTLFDWLEGKHAYEIYVDAKAVADLGPPSVLLLMESQWGHVASHAQPLDALAARWNSSAPAPAFMFCEPFYNDFATVLGLQGNCNHAPLAMAFGEDFLRRVYAALTSNPKKWARTLMIVCYDEHGGFFDHVAPPAMEYAPPPGHQWTDASPMTTLGVRVPGIIVSPLVEPGSAFHGLLDHTSILQLLVDRLGGPADLATFGVAAQRKSKGVQSLANVLTRSAPRSDVPALPASPRLPGGGPPQAQGAMARMFQALLAAKGG